MAGKLRHWKEKDGRFYARIAVPERLRSYLDRPRSELIEPLGADRRAALRLHPAAVAKLQHLVTEAEQKSKGEKPDPLPARFPLTETQMARSLYAELVKMDDHFRGVPGACDIGVDDLRVRWLRNAMAGKLSDDELQALAGPWVRQFQHLGNTDVVRGSYEWRQLARALCVAEYEALSRLAERDDGDFSGTPTHPMLANPEVPEEPLEPVSLSRLWTDYLAGRVQAGFLKDGGKRQEPVLKSLRSFLKHDDARRITKKDLLEWRDHLLHVDGKAAKTVNDIYLSTIRSIFAWAHDNERLPANVAATVRQPKPRKVHSRERGYTDAEALAVLKASIAHQPKPNQFGFVRETAHMTAAKRWSPILCAFSGARISEITQLRKEDIRCEGKHWVMRITPEAGTVKTGAWRDVPIHRQVVALGFIDFVQAAADGPLFHGAANPARFAMAAASVSDELAKWLRRSGIAPKGIQPNHAWRHRLKTKAREIGISDRVVDAIQGHAGRTAGDGYGDVTLVAKAAAIDRLPDFELT
ncbi:integrase [Pararhodobacter sp. SW119]|uniref:integrase n=1 Tax=Pararhodobacter sp. SW119 TaxID=2780075 RepID=UPI001ADEFA57|nr:integrase [Pararhodobacter sp. SW119]